MFALDLDEEHGELHRLTTYFNARYAFPEEKFVVEHSSGRRGLHILLPDVTLPYNLDLDMRRALGDCEGRLECSEKRGEGKHEILFNAKRKKGRGWVENLPSSERAFTALPAKLLKRARVEGRRALAAEIRKKVLSLETDRDAVNYIFDKTDRESEKQENG